MNAVPFDHTYILYDPNDWISIISCFFSLLPIGILIYYFSWLLLTREIEPVIVAGGQVVNDIINNVLKNVFKHSRPRPELFGVSNGAVESNFKTTLGRGLEYGMPSAHSQFMGFFLAFFTLKTIYQSPYNCYKLHYIACYAVLTFGVILSRVYLMYHNLDQVTVGVIVGFFIGATYFLIISIARDVGLINWIVNWRVLRVLYIKDSVPHQTSFKDEYELWKLQQVKGAAKK